MEEIWKDIPEYEGLYQVSNIGRVKSIRKNRKIKEIILSLKISVGYYYVSLYKNNKSKDRSVHQLVSICFLNHKPNKYKLVINHKNFIKTDNRVENLEIVSNRENSNHKHIKHSSKYTGVGWCKKSNKWQAYIYFNGKQKKLGYYNDEKEASDAYERELEIVISRG